MALIENVDYLSIPAKANEMREKGKGLNLEIANAYKTVTEMHEFWYGTRYNELVKSFNKMIPGLNDLLKLVVTDIPVTLETIANNYSQVDRGTVATAVNNELPKNITEIPVIQDVGMRFLTASVTEEKAKVQANFEKAKELMNEIEAKYNLIAWKSEAADAFKKRFTELKNQIVVSLDETNVQFAKLMEQTQQDIQKAENANTVN